MYTADWWEMWVDPSSHNAQSLKRPVAPRPVFNLLLTSLQALQASSSLNFIKASSSFGEYDRRLLSEDLQSDNACSSRSYTNVKLIGSSSLNLRATTCCHARLSGFCRHVSSYHRRKAHSAERMLGIPVQTSGKITTVVLRLTK
jgi:hypothetical protein